MSEHALLPSVRESEVANRATEEGQAIGTGTTQSVQGRPRKGGLRLDVTTSSNGTWPKDSPERGATVERSAKPTHAVRNAQTAAQLVRTGRGPDRLVAAQPRIDASAPQVGFIDSSDGANVRSEPGGDIVAKLAPGTRVVITGTHRDAPEWRSVTSVVIDDNSASVTLVQGYIKANVIATDAPEPGAVLYQVAAGDTAEKVVAKHYPGPKHPGFDLRFFQNVLHYVNRDARPQAVRGAGPNMQLVAGQRIWLVSPAYAAKLEGFVPSGSYTGGRFAEATVAYANYKSRVDDILGSMQVSKDVAGEYWEFLNENKVEIAALFGAILLADAWSWALAASPTAGAGQVVALGIQALLFSFGVVSAASYGKEAVKHGSAWLDLAWNADHKPEAIKAASDQYTHMLVQALVGLGSLIQAGLSFKMLPAFTYGAARFLRPEATPIRITPRSDDIAASANSSAERAGVALPSSAAPATRSTAAVAERSQALPLGFQWLTPFLRSGSVAPMVGIPAMAGGAPDIEEYDTKADLVAHLQRQYPALLKGFPPLADIEADFRAGGLMIDALIRKAKEPARPWFHKLKGFWEAEQSAQPLVSTAPKVGAEPAKPFPHIKDRTAIVSMRLPEIPSRSSGEAGKTVGGMANAILATLREMDAQGQLENGAVWIGWSGNKVATPQHGFAGSEVLPLAWFDFTEAMYKAVYEGVANSEFWFLLHSMTQGLTFNAANWNVFVQANQLFAGQVRKLMDPWVTVWLHDYQIPLTAKMLRELGHVGPIGQTWHVPWPAFDVLSEAPWWDQVVDALLHNDLVTFHIPDDVRNFVDATYHLGAQRVDGGKGFHHVTLKYKDKSGTIRVVEVRAVPIGIETKDIAVHPVPTVEGHQVGKLTSDGRDVKVIFGGGRNDPTKNFDGQILAYERFLETSPEWHGKVVLVQVSVPSRGGIDAYAKKQEEIREIIERINRTFKTESWTPIIHFERAFDQKELLLFYRLADVMAIVSLKDGMNLMAMESTASFDPDNPGMVVLSTGAGASQILTDAVLTNPHSKEDMAEAYKRALEMSPEERMVRHARNRARVEQTTGSLWGRTILSILDSFKSGKP